MSALLPAGACSARNGGRDNERKDSLCLCINGTDMDVQFLKAKAREKKAGGSPH
jgi:hypothetical protein